MSSKRFEEIKNKEKQHDDNPSMIEWSDIRWLIARIEKLEKESQIASNLIKEMHEIVEQASKFNVMMLNEELFILAEKAKEVSKKFKEWK